MSNKYTLKNKEGDTMSTARSDFERFVRWLYQSEKMIQPNVRKLANLILANFDLIADTSRYRSQRSVYLSNLIRQELITTEDIEPLVVPDVRERGWPWRRLKHLTLGPFRGFRNPEPFDLSKQITLFYGPNGSGKTSLCEGLEYSLLGDVEEAGAKRIAASTYLNNIHENRFESPTLIALSPDGQDINIDANPENYRFCFIERNRIDAFSRIAAKPNGQRAELIATLFGMEQFSDFVNHFNESIDSQLTLSAVKEATLDTLRTRLITDQNLVESASILFENLILEENAIARDYEEGLTYVDLKRLIGSEEDQGRLYELNTFLEAIPSSVIGLTTQNFIHSFEVVHQCMEALEIINKDLKEKQKGISFQSLYTAILELQNFEGDHCPACDTLLNEVKQDPFDKAKEGLEQLKDLASLQEKQQVEQRKLSLFSQHLRQKLEKISSFLVSKSKNVPLVSEYLNSLHEEPEGYWWLEIYPADENARFENTLFNHLFDIVEEIAEQDQLSLKMESERKPHIVERQKLLDAQLRVQAQDIKRQQLISNLEAAKRRIEVFDEENAELIELVAQESIDIQNDTLFKAVYDEFLEELKIYRAQLPAQLISGLSAIAKELYNSFNRNDRDEDKLSDLFLP